MQVTRRIGRLALIAMMAGGVAIGPHGAETTFAQGMPTSICGADMPSPPIGVGAPGPDGWVNEHEKLNELLDSKRYIFSVKEPGTAFVYVGDQWYNLNLGLFSAKYGEIGCWSIEGRGSSNTAERRRIQFVRPDERAIAVEPGDYMLTVRAGDAMGFDASKEFTVRIAVGPTVCALQPANIPMPEAKGMTMKPENPDLFQIGVAFTPDESALGPFALMTFTGFLSPPYSDLFDFSWEIDGRVVSNEQIYQVPYAQIPKGPLGFHSVKLNVKGAREYKDPTESQYNFMPFDGGTRSVTCTFRGPA